MSSLAVDFLFRPSKDQDGVHREQAPALHNLLEAKNRHHEEGLRAVDPHRHAGLRALEAEWLQVMLLVASETGHVYTFATKKLQPMISSEAGKNMIQNCLNAPDSGSSLSVPSPSPSLSQDDISHERAAPSSLWLPVAGPIVASKKASTTSSPTVASASGSAASSPNQSAAICTRLSCPSPFLRPRRLQS